MTSGIYKITNKTNGKIYIGASNNIEDRLSKHKSGRSEGDIREDILKYGKDNFTYEIIAEYPKEVLFEKEKEYINEYKKNYELYNKSNGGENPYNTTGYLNVQKEKCKNCIHEYIWKYECKKNGKHIQIRRLDLKELKKEVLARGLKWKIIDKETAKSHYEENRLKLYDHPIRTGFAHVKKHHKKDNNTLGYSFVYSYDDIYISSISIRLLEQKVKCKDLEWKVLDEDLAINTLQKNDEDLKNNDNGLLRNNTGLYNVSKCVKNDCKQGFHYIYSHTNDLNERKQISSISIEDLEKKVKSKKLPWVILDTETFKKIINEDKLAKQKIEKDYLDKYTESGVMLVSKLKRLGGSYYWRYYWKDDNGNWNGISNIYLSKLEEKVKSEGLNWDIFDEDKFNSIINEEKKYSKE